MTDIYDILVKERSNLPVERSVWPGIKDRMLQKDYSSLELSLIQKFNDSLSRGTKIEVQGFVTRLGGRRFLLRPSPGVLDRFIVCRAEKVRPLPNDYEFVQVTGYRRFSGKWLKRFLDMEIDVEGVESVRLPSDHLKPDISLNTAQELLFEGYVDMPRPLKTVLLLSIISSPKDLFRIGGLTTSLMPMREEFGNSIESLLRNIKAAIPTDLTSEKQVTINALGRVQFTPFSWRFLQTNSSRINSDRQTKVFNRLPSIHQDELTIGVSASSIAPKTIDELWIKRADFPAIVDTRLEKYHSHQNDVDLAKFLITTHLNNPFVSPEIGDNLDSMLRSRLSKLRRKYDSEGYGDLIDFDVNSGSPRMILHIAKAISRGEGSNEVSLTNLEEAAGLFEESRRNTFESWEDRGIEFASESLDKRASFLNKSSKRVYEFMRDNPQCIRAEIREMFPKVSERNFDITMSDLLEVGLIYRTSETDDRYSAV